VPEFDKGVLDGDASGIQHTNPQYKAFAAIAGSPEIPVGGRTRGVPHAYSRLRRGRKLG
jgi:hypothetical protein